jgi:NAD(P)-dependent dehydrogenase (short-subunit alcohol dehydrogenase family)
LPGARTFAKDLIAYASTKAAIVSFTRSLASLAIKQGVRVNAVAPGPVWTPLIPSTLPKEKVKQFGSQTVFGRAAQPAEIAPIFVFLASAQASYVTGEIYGATGGQMPIWKLANSQHEVGCRCFRIGGFAQQDF